MKGKATKTFLDTLLDPTSHILPFSSSYFDLARAAGIQRDFSSFGNGKILDGTDQDDTIHIEKDLTGGSPIAFPENRYNDTQINLMEGNDRLTVDGRIIVKDNQHISIDSGNGNTTVIAGGIEGEKLTFGSGYDTPSISISIHHDEEDEEEDDDDDGNEHENEISQDGVETTLYVQNDIISNAVSKSNYPYGNANKFLTIQMENLDKAGYSTIKVDGNIKSNQTVNEFNITGYNTNINIGKDITETNSSENTFKVEGVHNTFNIGGNITLVKDSILNVDLGNFTFEDPENESLTASFTAGDVKVIDGSTFSWFSCIETTHLTLGTLSVENNGSSIEIDIEPEANRDITDDVFINGNITAVNDSDISLYLEGSNTLEVTGVVSTQVEKTSAYDPVIRMQIEGDNSTLKFDGGFSINGGEIEVSAYGDNTNIIVGHGISIQQSGEDDRSSFNLYLGGPNNTFTLNGNISNAGSELSIGGGDENDVIAINGNVASSLNGSNKIDCDKGDDILILNGQINAGALKIDGGEGNDTLVLTADNTDNFAANYQGWLNDLSSTGDLAKSNFETIRLNVSDLQTSNLGWFTDIINKANASGANIAVEDKDGHAITNVNTFLAQGNDTHNPINDVLDQYAPAAANAAQPKAFADHVASPLPDAFTAPHFDNNNFLHEMEQQAQVHAAAAA